MAYWFDLEAAVGRLKVESAAIAHQPLSCFGNSV
jgi:hypothetical protein